MFIHRFFHSILIWHYPLLPAHSMQLLLSQQAVHSPVMKHCRMTLYTRSLPLILPFLLATIGGCSKVTSPDPDPVIDDITYIESRYHQPSIDAVIELRSDFREDSRAYQESDGTFGEYVGTDAYASAWLRNPGHGSHAISRASVNEIPLQVAGSNGNGATTLLDLHLWNTARSYHDTTNSVTIAAPTLAQTTIPAVQFDNAIRMENITRNQRIVRNQNLTLKWVPSAVDDFVEIDFMLQPIGAPTTTAGSSVGFTIKALDDNGSIVIPWQRLNDLAHGGFYSLELRRYQPSFFTSSDGARICVLGVSQHSVSIELVD
jgi:hypothetical protein